MSFENHYFYRSIHDHLESDVPREETQLYRHPKYRDRPEKARRRCEKIEGLIESVRENGYRRLFNPGTTAHELEPSAPPNEWIRDVHVGDEIVGGLDRNGRPFHLKNGRHGLAITQLLGVDRIPSSFRCFTRDRRRAFSEMAN